MKCLIIDDDKEFCQYFEKYVEKFLSGVFRNYEIRVQNDHFTEMSIYKNIDLLFIDIDLDSISGIEIIKQLKNKECNFPIIYVSSRKELVFSSLSTHPFYFIRKQNLEKDIEELFRLLKVYYKKTMKMITFIYYGRKTSIFLKDIHYIKSYGKDISIITSNQIYTYRSGLKDVLSLIDSNYVIRVHRNYAISLMFVKEVEKTSITLNDNTHIPIGKKYYKNFILLYKEFLIS